MAVFIVVPTSDSSHLDAAVKEVFPEDSLKLPRGEWFVKFAGTSQELTAKLGVEDGKMGGAVVASLSAYFGYAPGNIWEWLQSRWV